MRTTVAVFTALSLVGNWHLRSAAAGVIIEYQDVGADLQFDYTGSLDVAADNASGGFDYAAVSLQGSNNPVFYNSFDSGVYTFAGTDSFIVHTPGLFATNLPMFSSLDTGVRGNGSGTSFMFRLNSPGPTSSLDLWGDWGVANAPIDGRLTLFNQSAASIGMVDGWSVDTQWGSITFQAAAGPAVPEPSSLMLLTVLTLGVTVMHQKKSIYTDPNVM